MGKITTANPEHAIKEAVVAIFVNGALLDAEYFRPLVKKLQYNQFDKTQNEAIQIQISHANIKQSQIASAYGFRISKYTEDGRVHKVIQCLPEGNRPTFTFNHLAYTNWDDFLKDIKNSASAVAAIEDHNVLAFSLQYCDEFYVGSAEYKAEQIFNTQSKSLSADFFEADNVSLNTHLEHRSEQHGRYNQDLAIIIRQQGEINIVSIVNNYTFIIDDNPQKMSSIATQQSFDEKLNFAHNKNKATLKDLLNNDVQSQIKLIKS